MSVRILNQNNFECKIVLTNLRFCNHMMWVLQILPAHYKDPSGDPITIRNLKIKLVDVNARTFPPNLARKYLYSAVRDAQDATLQTLKIAKYELEVPVNTPWFEAWRETFFRLQLPSDHEFTRHFLACMIVVSSSDHNPVETMANLVQTLDLMQNTGPTKLPKWFNTKVLRYYILLHDNLQGNNVQ